MKPFVTLGALVASIIASAALAQTSAPNNTSIPRTPDNRSGLPKAPPDIVTPGSAARPFTGTHTPAATHVIFTELKHG